MNRYPNLLYIGPQVPGMVLEPIHLAFWRLTNLRTVLVGSSSAESTRSRLTRSAKRARLPKEARTILYKAAVLTSKAEAPIDIGQLQEMPTSPDLIFVAEVFRKVVGLETFSCKKAYYVQDPHISLKRYLDFGHLQDYDRVFVTQRDYVELLEHSGLKEVSWLPVAFDPDIVCGPAMDRDINIVFIGHKSADKERKEMVDMLQAKFGGVNPVAYLRDMGLVLRKSKLVFNKSRGGDLSPRVFEGMGAGAMVITDKIANGLPNLFEDGKDLVTYATSAELERLVGYYLSHDEERRTVARRGQQAVFAKHTYLHRASEVLKLCLGPEWGPLVQTQLSANLTNQLRS